MHDIIARSKVNKRIDCRAFRFLYRLWNVFPPSENLVFLNYAQFDVGNGKPFGNGFSDNRNICFFAVARLRNIFQNFRNAQSLIRIVGKNHGSPAVCIRLFKFFFQIFYVPKITLRRFGSDFDMRLFSLGKIMYINSIEKYRLFYVFYRTFEFKRHG